MSSDPKDISYDASGSDYEERGMAAPKRPQHFLESYAPSWFFWRRGKSNASRRRMMLSMSSKDHPTHNSSSQRLAYSSSDDESSSPSCAEAVICGSVSRPIFTIIVVIFSITGFGLYASSRSALSDAIETSAELLLSSQRLGVQIKSVAEDVRVMGIRLEEINRINEANAADTEEKNMQNNILAHAAILARGNNPNVMGEMHDMQKKLTLYAQRAEILKEQVQETSRQDSIRKYGEGVQRVEIELVFPNGKLGPTKFVMELAPLELMPHSVYMFLEMVSNHLLEGCSFILNALHVVKWAPLPFDGSPAVEKANMFKEKGLQSVAFREYSPKFPHTKYTIGFAADGSPSFYINTEDNTEIHVGDPCFAKVISGFDAVKRLEKSPTRNGIWFEQRIGIKRATILQS